MKARCVEACARIEAQYHHAADRRLQTVAAGADLCEQAVAALPVEGAEA